MSDTQMRQIEREMNSGDYTQLERYHYLLVRQAGSDTEVRLSAETIRAAKELPIDNCAGWGTVEVCDCYTDDCDDCVSGTSYPCFGCLACVAPAIAYGSYEYRTHKTYEWCEYENIHPTCKELGEDVILACHNCRSRFRQLAAIEALKVYRSAQ